MRRTMIGFCIGAASGVLLLAGLGAWAGYTHGTGWTGHPVLPPLEAAFIWAFCFITYFWWLAVAVGGIIGGLAGLGSWLVRPQTLQSTAQ